MYYTDYTKKKIFTDRQEAIISSRSKAKDAFFDALVTSDYNNDVDDLGNTEISSFVIRKVKDFNEIKALFETYEKNRSIVYEVKIELSDETGF